MRYNTSIITLHDLFFYFVNRCIPLIQLTLLIMMFGKPSSASDKHDGTHSSNIHLHTSSISRHNYGMTFTKLPRILMSGQSHYDVIFKVPIIKTPRSIWNTVYLKCPSSISCSEELNNEASFQFETLLAEIKAKDDNIRTLLEEPLRFPTSQRKAKSLFNFVGTISKKLFNIVTLDDIHDLARHISTIESGSSQTFDEQSGFINNILKYANYTSDRINIIEEQITNNAEQVKSIESQLRQWSEALSQSDNVIRNELDQLTRNTTFKFNINLLNQLSLYSLQQINSHLEFFLHGLNTLASGIIPTELVSPSDVRSALNKVKTNLYLNNRSFKVAHDDVSFYMQNHVSSYTYTQNNIYIHMQVPISDNDIMYEIYQTNVFPISLYSNDPHNTGYTIITNAAELFTVDRSKSTYIELSRTQLYACHHDKLILCPNAFPHVQR